METHLKIDTGDTTWLLISTALVMLMTPGLALFYGGMVRKKNVLGTIMQSFIALGVVTIQWVLIGYSLAFGPDIGHVIGGLQWAGLNGVGLEPNPDYAATVPHQAFMVFQMMFAVITPALITGAFAERFKFSTYVVFVLAWSTFVYAPIAHWVWGVGGVDPQSRRARLCRWSRCAHQLGSLSPCSSDHCRKTKRPWPRSYAASQHDDDSPWCIDSVVRMVWL